MLKKVFLIILLSVIFQTTNAQTYIGGSLGTVGSTFQTSLLPYDAISGLKVYIPFIFSMNKNLSFNTGLSYLNLGAKQVSTWGDKYSMDKYDPIYQGFFVTDYTFKSCLNYVSVPFTLNFYQHFRTFSLYERVGGYGSYLVSAKDVVIGPDETNKNVVNLSSGSINRTDAGILVGVGFLQAVGTGKLFLEIEYMHGKSGLYKSASAIFPNPSHTFNRALVLNVGYLIQIDKRSKE